MEWHEQLAQRCGVRADKAVHAAQSRVLPIRTVERLTQAVRTRQQLYTCTQITKTQVKKLISLGQQRACNEGEGTVVLGDDLQIGSAGVVKMAMAAKTTIDHANSEETHSVLDLLNWTHICHCSG